MVEHSWGDSATGVEDREKGGNGRGLCAPQEPPEAQSKAAAVIASSSSPSPASSDPPNQKTGGAAWVCGGPLRGRQHGTFLFDGQPADRAKTSFGQGSLEVH